MPDEPVIGAELSEAAAMIGFGQSEAVSAST
jgi:hypothetical protein